MICLANEFHDQLISYKYRNPIYIETTVVEEEIIKHAGKVANDFEKKYKSILFLSRVEKGKGIYETLDSFNFLRNKYPDIVLNIAGIGSELEKAKSYVKEKDIPSVNFLGWVAGSEKTQATFRIRYLCASLLQRGYAHLCS